MAPRRAICMVGAIVTGCIMAAVLVSQRSPYDFLDQFHPTHRDLEFSRIGGYPIPEMGGRGTLLLFRGDDSDRVLAAMKKELTRSHGFETKDNTWDMGRTLQFTRGSRSARGVPLECATYMDGRLGGLWKHNLESGQLPGPSLPADMACVVVLFHRESWLNRSVDSARRFLHW